MSTINISWGKRITILYLGFVAIIVALVVGSMRQDFDLVSSDYYGDELKYQEVIDAGKNQSALSAPVQVYANEQMLTLDFPHEFASQVVTGSVQFYSPVNSAWDKTMDITVENNKMLVQRSLLKNTRYQVKIRWQAGDKPYYQETEINLR